MPHGSTGRRAWVEGVARGAIRLELLVVGYWHVLSHAGDVEVVLGISLLVKEQRHRRPTSALDLTSPLQFLDHIHLRLISFRQ